MTRHHTRFSLWIQPGPVDQLCRRRPAQQVSLTLVTPEQAQELVLLISLDSFGNHLKVQVMSESDDRHYQCRIFRISRRAAYKRAIELHRIDRQMFEIA